MYSSVDFATKSDFRRAIRDGLSVVLYSPQLGTPAINGRETVHGPWPAMSRTPKQEPLIGPKERRSRCGATAWTAHVEVRDMRVVAVH